MAKKLSNISKLAKDKLIAKWSEFLEKGKFVHEDHKGCWIWDGGQTGGLNYKNEHRYPAVWVWESKENGGGFTCRGNIVAYFLAYSQVPTYGETCVSHLCHESLCINPDHLELETLLCNSNRQLCREKGKCSEDHEKKCFPHRR